MCRRSTPSNREEICQDLPDLAPEDVAEALRYAADAMRERTLPQLGTHNR